MASRQLRFWPPPRPLEERFGAAFFKNLPAAPGVYFFCGEGPGVLYVGSAANLRRRLTAYRAADPDRLPRRMVRLLQQVRRIEWDVCSSVAAARFREELLICVLAPKFNRAGKVWPREWTPNAPRPPRRTATASDDPPPNGAGH
ncbi:MAG: nucleotide excision repair endonuclease [Verrucomicrobiales bacterium]|nr:nucleotide excision repair endonuclease [Verrucomicrobiales bacterium]